MIDCGPSDQLGLGEGADRDHVAGLVADVDAVDVAILAALGGLALDVTCQVRPNRLKSLT